MSYFCNLAGKATELNHFSISNSHSVLFLLVMFKTTVCIVLFGHFPRKGGLAPATQSLMFCRKDLKWMRLLLLGGFIS